MPFSILFNLLDCASCIEHLISKELERTEQSLQAIVNKSESLLFNKDTIGQVRYDECRSSNHKVKILMGEAIKTYLVAKNIFGKSNKFFLYYYYIFR